MHGRLHHDALFVGAGKLLNGAASFFIRIYIVRFLDPAPYGVLSLGFNCLMLFDALVGSALDLGAMALLTRGGPCDTPRIQACEKAAIRLKTGVGVVLALAFLLGGEWLGYRFLHGAGGRSFFLVLTVAGTLILLVRSAQLYFQARLRFRMFAAIDVTHAALRLLLVALALRSGAVSALLILWCHAAAPAIVFGGFLIYGHAAAAWRKVSTGWEDKRAVFRASRPILAAFGVTAVVSRLDVLLLASRSTPAQLGFYGAAWTIATVPEILGAYLAPVFAPRILPACKAGVFSHFFRRFHVLAFALVAGVLGLALLVGKPALALLLPAKYAPSIHLVFILIPGTLAMASFLPLTFNFLMLTSPRTFVVLDAIAAPLLIAAYVALLPAHGAVGAAWITCVYRLAKSAIVQARAFALAASPLECRPAGEARAL